jgi:hypothetical protein
MAVAGMVTALVLPGRLGSGSPGPGLEPGRPGELTGAPRYSSRTSMNRWLAERSWNIAGQQYPIRLDKPMN